MLASQRAFFDALIVMTILVMATLLAAPARSQDAARPQVGGVISPPDAMIFYLAHGRDGACGPNCSEWIAAEGVVECCGSALSPGLRRERRARPRSGEA
jgi:hypothetical protein